MNFLRENICQVSIIFVYTCSTSRSHDRIHLGAKIMLETYKIFMQTLKLNTS